MRDRNIRRTTERLRLITAVLLGINAGLSLARSIRQTVDGLNAEAAKPAASREGR